MPSAYIPAAYIPIALFVAVATGFALFTLVFSSLIHSEKYNKVKLEPYECGIEPTTGARDRYSIRYYLVAMLFILFDIEVIFLYPIAVQLRAFGTFAMTETIVFVVLLLVALARPPRSNAEPPTDPAFERP